MSVHATQKDSAPKSRPVGRPRRLTTEQVLEAALAEGLDGLTMSRVAERLGVGVAVLYSYVGGREELIRLAAARAQARHQLPNDVGQPWAIYALEYAEALFDLMAGDAQLLTSFMSGGLGPAVQVHSAERWLQAMTARGFAADEAIRLQRMMALVVMGGAAAFIHEAALAAAGVSHEDGAREAATGRAELPLLSTVVSAFAESHDWKQAFVAMLRGVAASRGESLPELPAG